MMLPTSKAARTKAVVEGHHQSAGNKQAAPPNEESIKQANTIADRLNQMNLASKAPLNDVAASSTAFIGSTHPSSGFASLGVAADESCWSKTERKNRDKGIKNWQTFNILQPRQNAAARVTKTQPTREVKKPTKKQVRQMERFMKGYREAEDKFAFVHRLEKVDKVDIEVLGVNLQQAVAMKGQVERAGEFVEWEEEEERWLKGEWGEEWKENYDDENPFLNK